MSIPPPPARCRDTRYRLVDSNCCGSDEGYAKAFKSGPKFAVWLVLGQIDSNARGEEK